MCRICPKHPTEHGHLSYVAGDAAEHGCLDMAQWPMDRVLPPVKTDAPAIELHTRATLERMVHKGLRRLGIRPLTMPWGDK